MTELTKERLQEIAEDGFLKHGEAKAMSRQLLAGLEQEPVAYMQIDGDDVEYNGHNEFSGGGKGIPLYAAPLLPQPAVVMTFDEWSRKCDLQLELCDSELREKARYIWDEACRAAMLQGAEPASQTCTLRDGWVAVPVEATLDMVKAGAKAASDGFLIPGVYRSMLAAVPQQEVK